MGYVHYNPNPEGRNAGDCVIRAISKALGLGWETVYTGVALQGFMMGDMPSANHVWGAYLHSRGFTRRILPDTCPDCYTVEEFAAEHPQGTYILVLSDHAVCVQDGDWYDSWNSGSKTPLYYWERSFN